MKQIKTTDAVGHVLCHDITQIIKGVTKDAVFRKGHIIKEEDIPVLLSVGKDHIYIYEKDENMLHEDEAAEILRDVCINDNMTASQPKEGKIELCSTISGLFKLNEEKLDEINDIDEIMIATRHGNTVVNKGDKLLGTRVIPLVIKKEKLDKVKEIAGDKPIASVLPFKLKTCGLVTTGNEVFYGRIEDTFTPVIIDKLKKYGVEIKEHIIVNDDLNKISDAVKELKSKNLDMILCTGGMSVDPDDLTPGAIKESGANIVTYGAPVLPGAMFLLGYFDDGTPVMGLPGCVMYAKTTIFDIVLPRVVAGDVITRKEITRLGNGGLCLGCSVCTYPNCGFGK